MTNKVEPKPKLIFVYNADSGLKNAVVDVAHKIFSPKTYPCSLCDLTYGYFRERKAWKKFRNESQLEMKFLHADEFNHLYKSKFRPAFQLPIVLIENQYDLDVLISTETLNSLKNYKALIKKIEYNTNKIQL